MTDLNKAYGAIKNLFRINGIRIKNQSLIINADDYKILVKNGDSELIKDALFILGSGEIVYTHSEGELRLDISKTMRGNLRRHIFEVGPKGKNI